MKAIIVEGEAHHLKPPRDIAELLAETNNTKYAHYGLTMKAENYTNDGIWALRATRVIAWNLLFEDATRFRFQD